MILDASQLFCALVISIMVSLLLKSIIFPEKRKDHEKSSMDKRKSLTSSCKGSPLLNRRSSDSAKPVVEMHDVMELRNLSMVDLQSLNGQFSKLTDRYWREIFRRQNDSHHPDHINVSRLQTANIITVLDEHLPRGAIQELTITGLVPKPFSSRRCEVMRYLRERLSNSPNVELSFQRDSLRITSPSPNMENVHLNKTSK